MQFIVGTVNLPASHHHRHSHSYLIISAATASNGLRLQDREGINTS